MPLNRCMDNEIWYIRTMEYYSAIKKSETKNFIGTWMELAKIILSEVILIQKDKHLRLLGPHFQST